MGKQLVKTPPKKASLAAKTVKPTALKAKSKAKPAARPAVAKPAARPAAKPAAARKPAVAVSTKPAAKNGAAKLPSKKPIGKTAPAAVVAAKPVKLATKVVEAKPAEAAPPPKAVAAPVKNGVKHADAVARVVPKPQMVAGLANARPIAAKPAKVSRPKPEPVPVRLPPAPVRSDSKMARNRAGISPRELEHFRDLLFQKRREITGDVSSMGTTALHSGTGNLSSLPMHMADNGTDNYEQEFTLGLVEKDRKLLQEINIALAKIQDGSYGICEGTGKPISKPRLEAQPWAKYSIEHARALERPQYRRAF